jgi:hypothetical protein
MGGRVAGVGHLDGVCMVGDCRRDTTMKAFNVVVRDDRGELLADRRLDAIDSGDAANVVLDELKHPDEELLRVEVYEMGEGE